MRLARKSVRQNYRPTPTVLGLMENFRRMMNDCIRIGIREDASTLRRLSTLCYQELKRYEVPSYYMLCAISKAAGILASRKKSLKRGYPCRSPYAWKPLIVSCYGFKIVNGCLLLPVGNGEHEAIPLNRHTLDVLSSESTLKVRSFTMIETSLSLCVSREVEEMPELKGVDGVDRNLRNVAVGDEKKVTHYDVSRLVSIAKNSVSIVASFRRDDIRIRGMISSKYGRRRRERVNRVLHAISNDVVQKAKADRHAIVFEEITGIRRLYRRGNGQGRGFRRRMNSWPFGELKRQVEYKAAWEGVPVVTLTKNETRGTTMDCPRCGERLQVPVRGDKTHRRQLWCETCGRWMDRDVAAVLNISRRGRLRFDRSPSEGGTGEAVKGNAEHEGEPLILRVDATKLGSRRQAEDLTGGMLAEDKEKESHSQ